MTRSRGGVRAAPLFFVLLAGAALRIGPALRWPIRHDEVLTWLTAKADLTAFLDWTHHFHHPPLSYVLVRVSTALAGTDAEWALRFPSLVAGIACIPLAYLVGRALGSRTAGLLLSLLVAFDPLLVDQARQARMYSLYALLVLAVLYLLARPDALSSVRRWVIAGLALAGVFWTHVLGLVVWGGAAIGIALGGGERGRRIGAAKALALAVVVSIVGLDWLRNKASDAVQATASGQGGLEPWLVALRGLDSIYPGKAAALLLLLAAVLGLVHLRHRDRFIATILLGMLGLSILAVGIGAGDRDYGIHRYLLPLHLTAHVGLVSLAVSLSPARLRRVAAAGIVIVALLGAISVYPGAGARRDYAVGTLVRELADRHVRPGDAVKYVPRLLHQQGRYYGLPFERYVTVGRPLPPDYPHPATWIVAGYGEALPGYSPDLTVRLNPELPYVLGPVARHYGISYDEREVEELLIRHGALAVGMSRSGVRYVVPEP